MHHPIRFRSLITALLATSLAGVACSSNDRPPRAEPQEDVDLADLGYPRDGTGDGRDILGAGPCEDGTTQACRIYLPSHNDIQPCFVGEQLCSDGAWSDCGNGVLVDDNDDDAALDASDIGAP